MKAKTKKTHPADAANLALIPTAKEFSVAILKDRKQVAASFPTFGAARIEQAKQNAISNNGRTALMYAVMASGQSILVPDSYKLPADDPARKAALMAANTTEDAAKKAAAIRASLKEDRAPAKGKAVAPAKAAPAKKAAPKKAGESKADIAMKLLTRKQGISRKDLVEALGGWNIDLKQFTNRKALKMRKDKEGLIYCTPAA